MQERFSSFTLLIAKIGRQIRRIKSEEMAEFDLKSSHVSCLYYLHTQGAMTPAELCELCDEDKAAVSRSILYLEQKNYLTRETASEKGSREGAKHYRAPLVLTKAGSRIAEEIADKVDRMLEAVSNGVSDGERAVMYAALEQINRNLKAICEENGD